MQLKLAELGRTRIMVAIIDPQPAHSHRPKKGARRELSLQLRACFGCVYQKTGSKTPARDLTLSRAFSLNNPGDFLLSHAVTRAVPSAPAGLTSVFGMGTGVTLPTKSPETSAI